MNSLNDFIERESNYFFPPFKVQKALEKAIESKHQSSVVFLN